MKKSGLPCYYCLATLIVSKGRMFWAKKIHFSKYAPCLVCIPAKFNLKSA